MLQAAGEIRPAADVIQPVVDETLLYTEIAATVAAQTLLGILTVILEGILILDQEIINHLLETGALIQGEVLQEVNLLAVEVQLDLEVLLQDQKAVVLHLKEEEVRLPFKQVT